MAAVFAAAPFLLMGWAYYYLHKLVGQKDRHRIDTHVGLIPLPERGSIDLDNSALHQGIGADELIV